MNTNNTTYYIICQKLILREGVTTNIKARSKTGSLHSPKDRAVGQISVPIREMSPGGWWWSFCFCGCSVRWWRRIFETSTCKKRVVYECYSFMMFYFIIFTLVFPTLSSFVGWLWFCVLLHPFAGGWIMFQGASIDWKARGKITTVGEDHATGKPSNWGRRIIPI